MSRLPVPVDDGGGSGRRSVVVESVSRLDHHQIKGLFEGMALASVRRGKGGSRGREPDADALASVRREAEAEEQARKRGRKREENGRRNGHRRRRRR